MSVFDNIQHSLNLSKICFRKTLCRDPGSFDLRGAKTVLSVLSSHELI